MKDKLDNFINLLAKTNLNYYDFLQKAGEIKELTDIIEPRNLADWRLLGLELERLDNGKIAMPTRFRDLNEQVFCIVDIETSGGINSGQIIEIGAVKIQGGKEIGRFETLVWASEIPQNISELTGIYQFDLINAPRLANALESFRLFLADSVFVAHNVKFDYDFISISLTRLGFGMLLNRKICTIDLARRTIESNRYGLGTLKEILGIDNAHHRALNDAIAACEIFKECIKRLPWHIQSVEDLILFSKTAKILRIPNIVEQANLSKQV
ncbi:3'-5' exonuclease [Campylobacter sp. CX2-8023-23]|uniref:3'-5' exonuclease n=1 Tax=Campylobacter porcelli TaxID=1660073 RepID=A0ABU7M2K9_9BACT|nr:3'-5' exonuclease [Campylobacter sp. CX2-8023-23]MEE3743903.1 3'-5' exonuclease [Campylobacter sp. CX2-4855-23]